MDDIQKQFSQHAEDGRDPHADKKIGKMLADDLSELFHFTQDDGYSWADTKTALIEACYLAWLSGWLCDGMGQKMPFRRIVAKACHVLNLKAPRNPSSAIFKAKQRKDVRLGSLLSRYLLLQRNGVRDPFRINVRRRRKGWKG